jgi:hypothetical protein
MPAAWKTRDFVVVVDGTRLWVQIRPAFKDGDLVSFLTKEQRKHLARWSIPNDRHITDNITHGHSLLLEEMLFSLIKTRTTDNSLIRPTSLLWNHYPMFCHKIFPASSSAFPLL